MIDQEIRQELKSTLLHYLPDQEIVKLLALNKILSYETDEIILQQGKDAAGIYLILKGEANVTAKILGEGTATLETLSAGHFFGEISYIEQVPSATSVIAKTSIRCLFIDDTYFHFLSAYHPEIRFRILQSICKQVAKKLITVHDKITGYMTNADMMTISIFSEFVHAITKLTPMSLGEAKVNIQALLKFPAFQHFTAEELPILLKNATLLQGGKHCLLIQKRETKKLCYIVAKGAVQSSIVHDNKIAKLSVIGPATLFASMACVTDEPAFSITFSSCEPVIVFKLTEVDFEHFQKNYPIIWFKLFDLISLSIIALEKSVDKLDIRLKIETYNR